MNGQGWPATEEEWLLGHDLEAMLAYLHRRNPPSARKLRLFGVSCSRANPHLAADPGGWVGVIERFADWRATNAELEAVAEAAWAEAARYTEVDPESPEPSSPEWGERLAVGAAYEAVGYLAMAPTVSWPLVTLVTFAVGRVEPAVSRGVPLAAFVHDVFGNPFRPVRSDPSWRTSTVVALSTTIYEDRAFELMPILADALMDTGCQNDELLDHLRGPGPHVRGCWALDLVLGKS